MTRLLAVDPGEVFVGYAEFVGLVCLNLDCGSPDEAVDLMWDRIEAGHYDQVVAEAWRNYGDSQAWSECRTAEVIGVLRHKCRRHRVPFVTQPARIMRPGLVRAASRGLDLPVDMISQLPNLHRPHARSAWIHGAWWLCQQGLDRLESPGVG